MRKLLNNPWIVAALALAALAGVGHSLWPGQTLGPAATAAVVAEDGDALPADPANPGVVAPSGEDLTALTGNAVIRRDPFAPTSKAPAMIPAVAQARPDALDTIQLTALWSQDGTTYAVINGSILRPGDEIGRLKIESATTDGVWVVHWKGRDHLALGGEFTLRTPAPGPPAVSLSNPTNAAGPASSL